MTAGIWFSHYGCRGHGTRVRAFAQAFHGRFPRGNLFFLQAGLPGPGKALGGWGHSYDVPQPVVSRESFRTPVRGELSVAHQRSAFCRGILARERPGLFVTEYFPLGRSENRHELLAALEFLKGRGTEVWGIAGYPVLGRDSGWRDAAMSSYRKVLVFAPPLELDYVAATVAGSRARKAYRAFFSRHAAVVGCAGYLAPESPGEGLAKAPRRKEAVRVVVVRGGGAYYPQIIAQGIRAGDLLGKEYRITVVAGPSSTDREWAFFSGLAARNESANVTLLRETGDYEGLIARSDVCVGAASYHTAVAAMFWGTPSVWVPFEGYGTMAFVEQPARARMMQDLVGARVIPVRALSAVRLASAIRAAAREKRSPASAALFSGRTALDAALAGLSRP